MPLRGFLSHLNILKEASWVSIGQIVAFLGGLIGIKVLTNIMPPQNYGELALGVSVAGICNLFLFGPLGQIALRFYSVCSERGNINGYTRVLIRLHKYAMLLLVALALSVSLAIAVIFGWDWAWLLSLSLMFGIFSGVQGSVSSLLNALRDRKISALTQGLDAWLRMGFAALLLGLIGSQGYWAVAGYILGSFVVLAIQFWSVKRHGFKHVRSSDGLADKKLRREFLAYGLPFLGFSGLAVVSQYGDRWLLQSFVGEQAVGIYAAMLQIATAPVAFLLAVANQLIVPLVFAKSGNLDDRDRMQSGQRLLGRSVFIVGVLYALVTAVAYVWGETLLTWIANVDYAQYGKLLWVLVLSQALFNLAQFMAMSGLSHNRPSIYFWPKFGQAASLLGFGYPCVQKWGVEGIIMATLIASATHFLWIVIVNAGLRRVSVPC